MDQKTKEGAVGVTITAVAVFAAAFLPWGTIHTELATPTLNMPGMASAFAEQPLGDVNITLSVTGWNGTVSILGMSVPNWFAVAIAGAVAGMVWLSATNTWHPPKSLTLWLAWLGLAQILATWWVLVANQGGLGIGAIVAGASFVGMIYACRGFKRLTNVPTA